MTTDERFDESITSWLEATAPSRLPERVLEATFERTRTSRQQVDWRRLPGRPAATRPALALGGATVVLLAVVLTVNLVVDRQGMGTLPPGADAFLGTWISAADSDGDTETMTVRAAADGALEIVVTDEIASICSRTPSTMTGIGRLESSTKLVIPEPVYTCEDGTEPKALGGLPLQEQLRDLTYVHRPDSDTLTVGAGVLSVWRREGAEGPSPTEDLVADLEPVWPQTSLEEVRRAQELADARDPRYTWQVDPDLGSPGHLGQHHPHDAKIFTRFLEEVLGWEEFRDGHHVPRRNETDLAAGDVVYIRCAPGGTNRLYPEGPNGECAPTLDELRYETVKISVAQLDRQSARGIWVVTGWDMIGPAEQADPRVVEAEATALLEAFLQARIDGQGAEELADHPEIPLLYATSSGAPYARSEFELVDGPVWPSAGMQFEVRLFTESDEIVVEQVFSLVRDETGRLRLDYDFEEGAGDGPGTTENGKAVPVEYAFLDGEVTYRVAYPLGPSHDGENDSDRHAIDGLLPDDGAPRQILVFLADPRPIGPGCKEAPAPADAEALARSIQSDPDFEAGAPVAVTIGGTPALKLDVVLAQGASPCTWSEGDTGGYGPFLLQHAPFGRTLPGRGTREAYGPDRARLYLLDLPAGSKARVLALATITDEDSFETVLRYASPILDSIEFHTP